MPKFFVKDEQVDGENIKIVGEDVNHIVNVLRLKKKTKYKYVMQIQMLIILPIL